jgi:hypothetical protein
VTGVALVHCCCVLSTNGKVPTEVCATVCCYFSVQKIMSRLMYRRVQKLHYACLELAIASQF